MILIIFIMFKFSARMLAKKVSPTSENKTAHWYQFKKRNLAAFARPHVRLRMGAVQHRMGKRGWSRVERHLRGREYSPTLVLHPSQHEVREWRTGQVIQTRVPSRRDRRSRANKSASRTLS